MAKISHKLTNSFEGALAGGGDPATSPLYVFGPFLRLIVVSVGGVVVAEVTFGASVWMVVLTIAVVSAIYRLVMRWVTDGSGGSGLSEEEFGGWAVKVNAAVTFIEYTLTFLVSMAAMVTFIADRLPVLNELFLGIPYRRFIAIALSVLTGWLVNRGPKMAARTFGPATAGVLVLLWGMVVAAIWNAGGIVLPRLDLAAFKPEYLHFTIGGYVRILAVMTGIEVFANLVAAYQGTPAEKSKKAFSSLLIIMGTTAVTMLIVGPAILQFSDPANGQVSVFTQTMDALLPDPLPYIGTLVGVAVLMSASAASAQGLQNLALGLKERRYIPPIFGQPNRFEVADKPVWLEVAIVSVCFLFFGTHEETYLAIYAAGVFILLSMTGWAVLKRLSREVRQEFKLGKAAMIAGAFIAAVLTTGATVTIFFERFLEGAWTYFLFIPLLYLPFTLSRNRFGAPSPEMDRLGLLDTTQLAGFGFGQVATIKAEPGRILPRRTVELTWQPAPKKQSHWREQRVLVKSIVVLLDGSEFAAQALPLAKAFVQSSGGRLTLLSSLKDNTQALREQYPAALVEREAYLQALVSDLELDGVEASYTVRLGFIADVTRDLIAANGVDLVITSTRGKSGKQHWLSGGISRKLVQNIDVPILLINLPESGVMPGPGVKRILVALDGSIYSESVLPYARAFAQALACELVLMTVPAVPETESYRAADDFVETLRAKAVANMQKFLEAIARSLREDGLDVRTIVTGSMPARTIVEVAEQEQADMVMITSRGRGSLDYILIGSVAQQVVANTQMPVFIMPIHGRKEPSWANDHS
ncbi:MAG: universal stress protein [Chloroflexota bacterium]